jgi:outer membrane protein assembly factor BamB
LTAAVVSSATSRAAGGRDVVARSGVRGGLVVHVGCGDGRLATEIGGLGGYLVHGLDAAPENVEKARARAATLDPAPRVSFDRLEGRRLPYIDNLVNLVIADGPGAAATDEIMRVLAPGGVAMIGGRKTVKPRPDDIAEWTHYLGDATGNAVAMDSRIAPPRHMQWLAEPMWSRNHHKLASTSAAVTTRGRLFYIQDDAPSANMSVPGRWSLIARDAFSGVHLWERSIPKWANTQRGFRSGPVQLPRTLVASGDVVYVPVGIDAPLAALDAATGKTLRTFDGAKHTEEVVLADEVLYIVTGAPGAEQATDIKKSAIRIPFPNKKTILAVKASTGAELWRWEEPPATRLMPLTLAAAGGRVFFQAGTGVVCLDAARGTEAWSTAKPAAPSKPEPQKKPQGKKGRKKRKGGSRRAGMSVATLVVQDDIVLWADGRKLKALSARDGKELWEAPAPAGFRSPVDVFVIDGLVWVGKDFTEGRDLKSGEVKKRNKVYSTLRTAGHHHRCYRQKATQRYIMEGYRGIEFLDLKGENHSRNNWIRGVCQYGILPANGLIYTPPQSCGCYMEARLFGFWATSASREERPPVADAARLERGPAYGKARGAKTADDDWPTYRHDSLRSGSTGAKVGRELRSGWTAGLAAPISAPVVAGGTLIVSEIDRARIVALDAASGRAKWSFTAGGRVDSPPTVHEGLVLFGSADGRVYALRLSDGELVWRFLAAPADLRTVSRDQVESVWPVHGSVLVQNGVAYAAAGRYSYLDGGIALWGLDPATGRRISSSRVAGGHPKGDEGIEAQPRKGFVQNATDGKTFAAPDKSDAFSMYGARSDVLTGDGDSVYIRHLRFDRSCAPVEKMSRHLFSTSRLIDGEENHRSHWAVGTGDFSRTSVAYSWIANRHGGSWGSRLMVPYGVMLAFDSSTVWGVRRMKGYTLYATAHEPLGRDEEHLRDFRKPEGKPPAFAWSTSLGTRPRAIARAGDLLLIGCTDMSIDPGDPFAAYDGRKGGALRVHSATDGAKVSEVKLDSPPVWDGLAVAGGRLYMSRVDGKVECFE